MKIRATLIGFTAILMWSFLALLTAASGKMPPFQLSAITFAIGSLPGIITFILRPERIGELRQPAKVWLTGVIGLFGYHFLYFTALRNAPAVEAGLIAYLWPHNAICMAVTVACWYFVLPAWEVMKTFSWGWVLWIHLVNAGGIWGHDIARKAGVTVNMLPAKGSLLIFWPGRRPLPPRVEGRS